MKKIAKMIIKICLIFVLLYVFIFIFKNKHDIRYDIKSNDIDFIVNEKFVSNNYYIKISSGDYNFSFKVDNSYSKRKKIVDDIYSYELNDYLCIFPILDNDNIDIMCSNKDNTYSYVYLKDELGDFVNILKDKGYNLSSWDNNVKEKRFGSTLVYQDNIPLDTYIYVWKYNGFYTISSKRLEQLDILNNDLYVNDLGALVDKYYVMPDYNSKYEFDKFYVYNITNNKRKVLKLKESISFDSYINGVKDGKLYLFDKDNLVQYEVNPKKKKIKEIGNKQDGALYYDKEWINLSVYDFRDNELLFKDDYSHLNDIVDVTSLDYVYNNLNYYYYFVDNDFYVYDSVMDVKTLLFSYDDISYIFNVFDDVYFVRDNVLYLYNISSGISKILVYDELRFNTINRISIYKK